MTNRDTSLVSKPAVQRLQFDRFVLDLARGCLLLDGADVGLRPKTFAVLQFLVENSGRLVTKDELFAAAWPEVTVTDDVLVQSIGELRRALGDSGPHVIKTVPRRGYRFEAPVSLIEPGRAAAAADPTGSTASADAREARSPPERDQDAGAAPAGAATAGSLERYPTSLIGPALLTMDFWRKTSRQLAAAIGKVFNERIGQRIAAIAISAIVVALSVALWTGLNSGRRHSPTTSSAMQKTNLAVTSIRPAIAVLPFANQSDDPTREYFADGVTQDIINALGRFSALTVMSWNAVLPLKGKTASPGEVTGSLGVRYLVEGSVRQAGDRLRVTAQLVGSDGRVIWSDKFDEALADVFVLQDKIVGWIVGALAIRVTQTEQRRVRSKPTDSLLAYDYVLRARPALQRPDRARIVEARSFLRRAIELDPDYAEAYQALAETHHIDVSWGWAQSPAATLRRAEDEANRALRLNDGEVGAHILLGRVHLFYNRFEQAKEEMDRAIAINPSDAAGLGGRGNILMWLGETDAAIEALEQAQRVDPDLNAVDRFSLAMAYYLKRRYDAAIAQAELNLRNSADSVFSYVVLAAALAQLGLDTEVARVSTRMRQAYPAFDAQEFGSKFRKPADLAHLRDGLRKADLSHAAGAPPAAGK